MDYKKEFHGGWIGVDFDGTLVTYNGWKGPTVFGDPIPSMVERVKKWIAEGVNVRVMTARVSPVGNGDDHILARDAIEEWCKKHIGKKLPVVCEKDYNMMELWDDRVVQVEFNTGVVLQEKLDTVTVALGESLEILFKELTDTLSTKTNGRTKFIVHSRETLTDLVLFHGPDALHSLVDGIKKEVELVERRKEHKDSETYEESVRKVFGKAITDSKLPPKA